MSKSDAPVLMLKYLMQLFHITSPISFLEGAYLAESKLIENRKINAKNQSS